MNDGMQQMGATPALSQSSWTHLDMTSRIKLNAYRKNLLFYKFQASYAYLDSAKRTGNKAGAALPDDGRS